MYVQISRERSSRASDTPLTAKLTARNGTASFTAMSVSLPHVVGRAAVLSFSRDQHVSNVTASPVVPGRVRAVAILVPLVDAAQRPWGGNPAVPHTHTHTHTHTQI